MGNTSVILRNRNAQPVGGIGWVFFIYLPFFLYFLPVATLAVTVTVTVDGAMMRR